MMTTCLATGDSVRGRETAHLQAGRSILVLALSISAYLLTNAQSLSMSPAARFAYGVIITVTVWMVISRRSPVARRVGVPIAIAGWGLLVLAEALQIPLAPQLEGAQALTDMMITLSPVLMFFGLVRWSPNPSQVLRAALVVTAAGVVAALYGWLTGQTGARFEAPPIVGIVGSWAFATLPLGQGEFGARARRLIRIGGVAAVIVLVPAVYGSRSRTSLLIYILSGLAFLLLPGFRRAPRSVVLTALVLLLAAAWTLLLPRVIDQVSVAQVLQQTRAEQVVSGRGDASIDTRLREIADVRNTMRIEGSSFDRVVGFGHGASYVPQRAYIISNVNPETGRVHNIHVTPVTVWFRYGWIGVVAFAALMLSTVVAALQFAFRDRTMLGGFLLILVFMYMIDLMFRNSLADPMFGFAVAVVHYLARRDAGET